MATKEQQGIPKLTESTVSPGAARVGAAVVDEAKPKRSTTYPISGRVAVAELVLIDEAAKRREMKRSDLVVAAVLQFIGKGRAGARAVRVDVPDEVRREVRATQKSLEQNTVALNRLGHNVLPQLKRYWSGENVHNGEIVALLTSIDQQLATLTAQGDQSARKLRDVLTRDSW
ncbi:uncharacterized protein (DUF1778 family) [Leucobacter exalbidus]|uniref:Uncharacterized protein (DUF1778 family) n=1 Tax=Leucobacter exalbidus TaxID=662960 RepID=A0A940PL54_9MICO|nr:hypothetical protein [Leucobacter exalbidus]MBP1325073.1 uncharacterized protein (DUF1778 family) [Leucobacter exalbidus]